ncbi:nesprin-2-like isoform X1 [Takifugu rubripes]|uniref:nesprin-2-like isoform X1 n=1 Tax=Takifugu rubripes TaxID=31033 RepID=UPI0011452581|nr:nesprin-2-like isoform X1 [Takifugu rubripes]
MSSDFYSRDEVVDRGSVPLDIDDVHMLLQVEQEQIQKKTFTNWVNAQLAKRRPPCMILDLFQDFRDGSRLLDLLEVMSGQRLSRERGRGMFQHRSNIEKALSFLKAKSIKLVNINIPDIIDGKPSIILGLIWTIILQYHIEELASSLSFSSRQSSMESLASLDSRSTLSSRSASSSPVPPRGSPLHRRFRVSAKKALLLWVREQCHKAGCTLNVKDFKTSWRSGVVFLAILYALRPDVVDLSKARTRSNRQNLEEAFRVAESELRIPKLLDPDDVDVRDPDEKSIMTYVAQFLQYSKDLPVAEEDVQTQYLTLPKSPSPVSLPLHYTPAVSASPLRQASPDQKVKEVTCWLLQALDELLEGWDSTEGESYAERYHVFHTFVVSFSEQRRSIIPLLTATRRSPNPSREQRALREAWDALAEKLRDYRIQLDTSLPAPLDAVARWLLKTEGALGEEETEPQDHGRAADDAKEKQELLKVCLEEMPQHLKTFQSFQNTDHDGNMMVPSDKLDELKRRFTSVRVSAKYHGIKLEYRELRHTALDLLGQIRNKLQVWKRPYVAPEAVRVLLQEWHECVNTRQLPSLLESTLHKLKQVSEKYSSKSALAADYPHVSQQVKQLEEDGAAALAGVATAKSIMGRVLSAWESYGDCLSSLQAWLEQNSVRLSHGHRAEVTAECLAEWESRRARMTEAGTFLMEFTDPQTSRILEEELRRFHLRWTEFTRTNSFAGMSSADTQVSAQDVQTLVRESTLILKEPLEAMTGPLHTYRKRLQLIIRKLQEVDFDALSPSSECPADHLQKLKLAVPEVLQTLLEAEQVCAELQHSVSGLDWRLAELHFWITEAREVYQHLKTTDRQRRGQDPRARVLISRGLQLEGQVVTEDQDLQVMVMTSQKNSPIQYLHASAMQERVRGAVAQSQEVVGMLSSLGARRDRSRSPSEGRPPTKVFIQDEKTQRQVDSGPGCLSPQVQFKSQQCHDPFLPKIVVQEYSEEKMPSALSVCAQSLMANEGISGARDQSYPQTHQQSQEEEMAPQQQPLQQVQQPEPGAQKQQWQQEHQQHPQKYPVQKQSEAKIQVQTQVQEEPEPSERASSQEQGAVKLPLTPQELQSRKAKAAKNRPWLQKPAERLGARPDSSQANVESIRAQPELPVQGVPQQSEKELKKREQEQVQLVRSLSDPSTESTTAPFTQPPLKKKAPSQPQAKVGVQPAPQTAGQALPEVAYSPTGGQPPPKTVSQTQSQDPPQTRVQTHFPAEPQLSTPSQGLVPEPVIAHAQIWAQVRPSSPMQASLHGHIQPPVPAHIQLRSHPPSWAPVRPPSPKPPTHPQSHMQTTVQPGTMTQPMTQNAPLDPQPQGHPRPLTTVQYSDHFSQSQIPHWTQVGASTSVAVPQLHAKMQPLFYPQGYVQGQAPAQPWVPQQEPHIQAVPQQRHPISQAYPQQMAQAPESQGHPTGTVPPQWPPLGPPLGPSGYSAELSYTQPRMQTEALPQVINWSSSTQTQMTTYDDLLRIQTHPGQVQQQTWVQTSSQHQPQDYSHTLPQMPLQPPTLPLAQQHIIAKSPLEVKPQQPSPDSQLPAQTRPQMHSTSESPEKCKNSAQLPPQGELQSPVRSKPPPVTEPSFPTEPMGQSAFKAESSPPTQHVPPTQPHPKDQAQGQVKDDLCDQPEVELDVAPSPPEYPSPIQHQVQSPAQPKVMSPAQPGPPGQVSTSPEAQSPSQPRSEGQSQAKPPTPSPPRAQKSQTLALYQEDVLPPGPSESPGPV